MTDPIRQPAHYRADSGIEAIDVIEAWGLGFCAGNVVKYVSRAGHKPDVQAQQDYRKALWYLGCLIGGKNLANEVAQLVAMELADVQTPRMLEPVEEEGSVADEMPVALPTLAPMPVEVTPDVTLAPVPISDDLKVESAQPSNQPAPIDVIRQRGSSKPRAARVDAGPEGRLREQARAQGLISSADLAARAGIGASGISWHVREGNLTPAIPSRGGNHAYFTPEEAQRFLTREDRSRYGPPPDPALWMSVQDAAAALSMSESAVKRNVETGRLESVTSRHGRVVQRWISRQSVAGFSPATRQESGRESLRSRMARVEEVLAQNPDLIATETARQVLGLQSNTGARAALHKAGIEAAQGLSGFTKFYRRADVEALAARRAGGGRGTSAPSASLAPTETPRQPEQVDAAPADVPPSPPPALDGIGPAYQQARHMEYMACIAEAIGADLPLFWVLDIEERDGKRVRRRAMLLHSTAPGGSALSSVALCVRRCGHEWVYRGPDGEMVTVGRRQAPDSGVPIPSTTGARVSMYGAGR